MRRDERVLTRVIPKRRSATVTTSTTAAWVTVTIPDPEKTNETGIAVAKRAEAAATTTTTIDTGIRREHAGGIIIGVSIGGLILLVLLAWCCTSGRRRSRFSDTSSSSRSTSRPSHSPPPKSEHAPTPYYPPVTNVQPPPSSRHSPTPRYIPPLYQPPVMKGQPMPRRFPPVVADSPPSRSGYIHPSKSVPPPGEKRDVVRPLKPPKVEEPTQAGEKPARTRKATRKKDGREFEFAVDEENPKKATGWVRKNLNVLPRPAINTLEE
jgi:hypothetical protein